MANEQPAEPAPVPATPADTRPSDGDDFAWRVHDALDSWTAKVDTKASIVLAIEMAVVGFVVTMSDNGGRLSGLHGDRQMFAAIGLVLVLLSVVLSLLVVAPQLGRRKAKKDWETNMIYFGHLRRWNPNTLTSALEGLTNATTQLAHQLVTMSKYTWRKHVWLQWSLGLLVLSLVCLGIAGR